jgi:hypothetical protein
MAAQQEEKKQGREFGCRAFSRRRKTPATQCEVRRMFARAARERDEAVAWPWSEKASQIPTRLNRMTEEHE